jgi:protein TonB
VLDYMPPELPEPESFPFDPNVTRAPEPKPKDAVAIERKKVAEKPTDPERKAPGKPKAKPKKKETPKKQEAKQATPPPAPEKESAPTPAQAPAVAAQPAPAKPAAPAKPTATQNASREPAPAIISNPAQAGRCKVPDYPRRAAKRNLQGTAVVRFMIGADGRATDLAIVKSTGHEILDAFAIKVVANCEYVPAKRGGRAVPALAERTVPFILK